MDIKYYNETTWNDRWIVEDVFNGMEGGFYVEAGAVHGKWGTSTYVLEKNFNWTGILVEPNPISKMVAHRPNSICVAKCLGRRRGNLDFIVVEDALGYSGCPSLCNLGEDWWWDKVKGDNPHSKLTKIKIECAPLSDILDENNAPSVIDYLTLDIEGAEEAIITTFPFDKYKFKTIAIEYASYEILRILFLNGYTQVSNPFTEVSKEVSFENYFIHNDYLDITYRVRRND